MGTRKFASFCASGLLFSSVSQLALLATAITCEIPLRLSTGPYFFIFSQLPFYYSNNYDFFISYHFIKTPLEYVPKTQSSLTSMRGMLSISEKSWVYLLAFQLLLSEGWSSFLVGMCGTLAGTVYMMEGTGIQKLRWADI